MLKRKGFTLIELLIVIVVLGILSVMVVPKVLDYPKKARDAQRKQMVASLETAMVTFLANTNSTDVAKITNLSGCAETVAADADLGKWLSSYTSAPKDSRGLQTIFDKSCNAYYKIEVADNNITGYAFGMRMEVAASGNTDISAAAPASIAAIDNTKTPTGTNGSFFVVKQTGL